jgi:hypothetical protein
MLKPPKLKMQKHSLNEDLQKIDISPETFIKRIPFLKKFKDSSGENKVFFQNVTYNKNIKYYFNDEKITFDILNTVIEFTYLINKIRENYFFYFNLDFKLIQIPSKETDTATKLALKIVESMANNKYNYNKEIISKQNHLTNKQLNDVINEINGKFFEIEDFFEKIRVNIQNPLDEAKKTDFSKEKKQGLHGWFARRGGSGSSGWVDCNTCKKDPKTGRKKCKPCGRQEGEKRKYPACRPTPASCGTKGRGKSWGKKSSNENKEIKKFIAKKLHEAFHVNDKGEFREGIIYSTFFPKDLWKNFKYNYGHIFEHKFDWNREQDKFRKSGEEHNNEAFLDWVDKMDEISFKKNLDKTILALAEDMVQLKRKQLAELKLEKFEELILPVFQEEITFQPSKFLYNKIMGFYNTQTLEELQRAYEEAENIMDKEGNIDHDKITPSGVRYITVDKFEDFVKKNPQFKTMYDIWSKLNDDNTNFSLKELNAYHIVTLPNLKKIYNILKQIKQKGI